MPKGEAGKGMNAPVPESELWRSRLDLPNYEVREAARYAHVHTNTVWRWHKDTTLSSRDAGRKLSYLQLIELAVAAACRQAGMKLADIRVARAFYAATFKTKYPFATLRLKTDGVDLAMDAGAELLIGNKSGQLAWKSFIGQRFKEFDYEGDLATRWHVAGTKSPVVIDPRVRFGAPHVSGVPTWLLRDRWIAGEPMDEITDDLSLKSSEVLAAIRFEGVDPEKRRKNEWLN